MAIFALILSCATSVLALEIRDNQDFLISQDYASSEQNNPSVAVGLHGKFAVIWADMRNGNGDVFCRLYDSSGVAITDEFILNDDTNGAWQLEPELSSDWNGNYYVVWKDYRNNVFPFGPDIYFQKLDSIGKIGINQNITTELPDSAHQSPTIGSTGWGKSVVAWTDLRNRNWDIYSQLLDISGNPIGENRRVNDDVSITPQHEPAVALSPDGWYVVAWYDKRNGNDDVFIQKFDSSGLPVGSNRMVNDDGGTSPQKFPSVAIGGDGSVHLTWTDWRLGDYPENSDIYYQKYDSALNKIGANILVNHDGAGTSQRDPKISSDRMGNACIIWSDSSATGWDIKAQMIDNYGNFRDGNFTVNNHLEEDQLFGDVSLDGYYLYFSWADNRNGQFDIYGKIQRYNDPTLNTTPNRVDIVKDKDDADSETIAVAIQNSGYGELDYQLRANQAWIELSKDNGTTPDSFTITLNPEGLGIGAHIGQISLIDITHGDSTAFIPVSLTITGPEIALEPSQLEFQTLLELGNPASKSIAINNGSTGSLNWTALVTEDWISLDRQSGTDGDIISVECDVSSLTAGDYSGYIIISDTGAINSPESLLVSLTLYSDIPYLVADPAVLSYSVFEEMSLDDSVRILNMGGGSSNWSAVNYSTWLSCPQSSGTDNDYLVLTLSTSSLAPGYYRDSIEVSDSTAYKKQIYIPVDLAVSGLDTIFVPPVNVGSGNQFQVQFFLQAVNELRDGNLSFLYDTALITIDSVLPPDGELSSRITSSIKSDSAYFDIQIGPLDSLLAPNQYHLCDIYGTAGDSATGTTKFSAVWQADKFYLTGQNQIQYPPYLDAGDIEITSPTSIDDQGGELVPAIYSLGQNFPNPFNHATTITYSVARYSPVRLDVYNILGQRVATLVNEYHSAGEYQAVWNGTDTFGEEVASGIYLYRFSSPEYVDVKKLVFLK